MSRLFLVGDLHSGIDMHYISNKHFPIARQLDKNDTVICLGDAGFAWDNSKESNYWNDWAEDRPFTLLSLMGNHENYDIIRNLPIVRWREAKVRMVRPHVGYIENGQIFSFNGFSFFTMGGARSVDRAYRVEGKSWWRSEIPSYETMDAAAKTLSSHGSKVDFILSHCGPTSLVKQLCPHSFMDNEIDPLMSFFEKYVCGTTEFTYWFLGHYHQDRTIGKFHILYHDIIEIMPDGTLELRNV